MVSEVLERSIVGTGLGGAVLPAAEKREADVFGRIGSLETRLARNEREIDAAQQVRFRVFVEEMGARLPADAMRRGRDIDAFDAVCDHLLVLDNAIEGDPEDQIVGTYRLLRQETALRIRVLLGKRIRNREPDRAPSG